MKRLAALLGLSALLVIMLFWVNHQRQQTPAYILSHYTHTPGMDITLNRYLRPDQYTKQLLLCESWFRQRTETMTTDCNVRRGGNRLCRGGTTFRALQSEVNLNQTQREEIQTELQTMPPSQTPLDINDVLIIGYWRGANWTVRIYERSNPPVQITRIHQIMGAKN